MASIMREFWIGKKVLITGHTGFKGMWLSLILNSFKASVDGISSNNINSTLYNKLNSEVYFNNEYFFDIGKDFTDNEDIIFRNNKYDVIFHFASQSLVSVASIQPFETLKTNVLGTYQIINNLIKYETSKSVIVATTDKVYKNSHEVNKEDDELGGNEFYSSSKVAQEMILEAFKNIKNNTSLNITTIRSGNVLGPGDGAKNRLITDVISSLKSNKDIILRKPKSVRPWQDIFDSLSGYLLAAEKNYLDNDGAIYNLNTHINNDVTTLEVTQKMIDLWSSEVKIIESETSSFYESEKLRLDSSKAQEDLGWTSKLNIDQTLKKIVEWEKKETLFDIEEITFAQIDKYFEN